MGEFHVHLPDFTSLLETHSEANIYRLLVNLTNRFRVRYPFAMSKLSAAGFKTYY